MNKSMNNYLVVLLLFFGLSTACHKKAITNSTANITPTNSTSNPTQNSTTSEIKSVTIDPEAEMVNTGAVYVVDSLKINEDTLSVFVNYSGGCKEHSFELISRGMYTKSLPPQISVCLRHVNNEDACRMVVMKELKFNIAKLKHPTSKTVVVKLGNEHRINYTTK
jgi:hypothetical protein